MKLISKNQFALGMFYKYVGGVRQAPMVNEAFYQCVRLPADDPHGYAILNGPIKPDADLKYVTPEGIQINGWADDFETTNEAPGYVGRMGCHHEFVPVEFIGTETVIKNICRLCDMEKK